MNNTEIVIEEKQFSRIEWDRLPAEVNPNIVNALKKLGFIYPTAVQNKDVFVEAITGSGKTLAFLVPLLQRLMNGKVSQHAQVGAIVIAPTRELARQTYELLTMLMNLLETGLSYIMFTGGEDLKKEISTFQKSGGNIIIATPGRLADLFSQKSADFNLSSNVKFLVSMSPIMMHINCTIKEVLILDEGDKLLDLGFEKSLNCILSYLPKQRRTGLFSATQTEQLEQLVRAGMRNPFVVRVVSTLGSRTPQSLQNYYLICNREAKFDILLGLIKQQSPNIKALVFFSTCASVDYFGLAMQELLKSVTVYSLHGKMRHRRYSVFDKFRNLKTGLLLCTDVMARGIDILNIDWVIQFDPPSSASAFVHRCGRTARQGHKGAALLMLCPEEDAYIHFLECNQKVVLHPLPFKIHEEPSLHHLQKMALADRARFDKANRAFVSFVQSYKKHECNLIFRIQDLNMGKLATCFGLLKMPRMPELKGKTIQEEDFSNCDVDVLKIRYKDKYREKLRQERLKQLKETGVWPSKKNKQHLLRKKLRKTKTNFVAVKKKVHRTKKHQYSKEDLEEIIKDAALLKKFKKRKVQVQLRAIST